MIDVAVVDIHLPQQNGIELVKLLKPKLPSIQFVMYTSLFDTETVFSALKAGATGYLTKETQPEKLNDAIKEAFNGGSPMSSDIARKIVKSFHEFSFSKRRRTRATRAQPCQKRRIFRNYKNR